MSRLIRVVIESPYAGNVDVNIAYAKRCVRDCLRRGEAPYASHLFFTQPDLLDDSDPLQRALGIEAGLAWGEATAFVVVYIDRGISHGMRVGIQAARRRGCYVHLRALDREVTKADEAELEAITAEAWR